MGEYRTIAAEAVIEDIIEKSKFIGYCKPVESEAEANAFIEMIKKRHKDATHNVPVFVLGERFETQRYSDDGEPQGTAGVPILSMMKHEGLTNLVVVVTRYFGGIKLGTGGLVRAYTNTAKKAFEAAGLVDMKVYAVLSVTCDYTMHGKVANYIEHEENLIQGQVSYTDRVTVEVYCHLSQSDFYQSAMVNLTNGKADVILLGEEMRAIPVTLNGM